MKTDKNQRFIENAMHFRSARKSENFRHFGPRKSNGFSRKIILILMLLMLASCSSNANNDAYGTVQKEKAAISVNTQNSENSGGIQMKYVTIEMDKGTIKAELYTEKAPITTTNFIGLANSKFYDGLTFHRVEPGFVVQGGDPKGDGTGGSGKSIMLEVRPSWKHVKGALAMARTNDPNSATSQFYIALEDIPFLDGQYAVFGKVISGMDVVEQIKVGDKMNKVYITDK